MISQRSVPSHLPMGFFGETQSHEDTKKEVDYISILQTPNLLLQNFTKKLAIDRTIQAQHLAL